MHQASGIWSLSEADKGLRELFQVEAERRRIFRARQGFEDNERHDGEEERYQKLCESDGPPSHCVANPLEEHSHKLLHVQQPTAITAVKGTVEGWKIHKQMIRHTHIITQWFLQSLDKGHLDLWYWN